MSAIEHDFLQIWRQSVERGLVHRISGHQQAKNAIRGQQIFRDRVFLEPDGALQAAWADNRPRGSQVSSGNGAPVRIRQRTTYVIEIKI